MATAVTATIISDSDQTNAAATTSQFSINFGNAEAINQIRSLTDAAAMTRLLHQCIAYQRSLDINLDKSLSRRSDLDNHLLSLQKSSNILSIVRSDSDFILSSVRSTAHLAESVSSKVRELDFAQSRVSSTLLRLGANIDKSRCIDGVQKSLDSEDYESAAKNMRDYLEIDSKFRGSSGSIEREQMLGFKKQLEGIVKRRLTAAIDQRDHPTVLRFIRLYSMREIEEEGLQVYVHYLKKVIAMRFRMEFEQLAELIESSAHDDSESGFGLVSKVDFVGCLTNLFKDIVMAVEQNDEILRSLCGEDGVVYAICELQGECDSRATSIVKKYMDYRNLGKLASKINCYSKNSLSVEDVDGPDPREVELYIEEILSLMQLREDYVDYMVGKIKGLSTINPEVSLQASKAFRSGSFNRIVQDITGFYVILEEFFMVENVRKAMKIDEHVPDSLTTSMVDDVFYVLQNCSRRAISTLNINSVLAVLSGANNLLGNEYLEALQRKTRDSNLGAKLFLGGVGTQKTGIEIATALNNMDVSNEYVAKLRHKIEEQCAEVFPAPADKEKIKSCLSELDETGNAFKQTLAAKMDQLVATLTPQIRPVLDNITTISYNLSEAEYSMNEANDPWVQCLLHVVETNASWFQPLMTANNYDFFVHLIIDFITKRIEVIMMQKRFSQLGGLQLDRDVRALVTRFSSMTQRTVRDKFARLTQMATLLNLEKVSEILDFWGENSGPLTWRLSPYEVRKVLGLRVDFKPEAIAALKL